MRGGVACRKASDPSGKASSPFQDVGALPGQLSRPWGTVMPWNAVVPA